MLSDFGGSHAFGVVKVKHISLLRRQVPQGLLNEELSLEFVRGFDDQPRFIFISGFSSFDARTDTPEVTCAIAHGSDQPRLWIIDPDATRHERDEGFLDDGLGLVAGNAALHDREPDEQGMA